MPRALKPPHSPHAPAAIAETEYAGCEIERGQNLGTSHSTEAPCTCAPKSKYFARGGRGGSVCFCGCGARGRRVQIERKRETMSKMRARATIDPVLLRCSYYVFMREINAICMRSCMRPPPAPVRPCPCTPRRGAAAQRGIDHRRQKKPALPKKTALPKIHIRYPHILYI